ncbi:LysR family transcriptional regulator [Vibrio sp. CAIM 722]|uniref:LysR family transcriptional regulator n=1 Tax=Vibrio eleionomae TaxID=2653505 RepID=A0A7X4RU57_9VIBR|nr:LysR family transcriptional regulator [Vibrio eleionomae]MZI92754.1 LysR family transcriptional regulator [Vibrio eleionomae]
MYHFNIRALEYLNSISRYGSLRKASKMMNVDPATISRMLTQLEEQVEVPVWERLQNGAKLTEAGVELLNFFRSTLAHEAAVYSRLHDMKALKYGKVSIAVGEGFIADLISKPMQHFMTQYPGIELSIETAGAADAIQLLEDQQIDFAVTYASAPHPKLRTHIERSHPLDIIVPKGHELIHRPTIESIQDIVHFPLALIDGSTGMGRLVKIEEQLSHVNLTPKLNTNSVSALTSFVTAGLGITVMPRLTVIDEIDNGLIEVLSYHPRVFAEAKARVLSLKDRELTLQAKTFMEFLITNSRFLNSDAPDVPVDALKKRVD